MWYVIGGIVIGTLAGAVIVWLFSTRKCAKCSEAHYERNNLKAAQEDVSLYGRELSSELAKLYSEAVQEVEAAHEAKVEKAKQSMNKAKSAAQKAAEKMGERR